MKIAFKFNCKCEICTEGKMIYFKDRKLHKHENSVLDLTLRFS